MKDKLINFLTQVSSPLQLEFTETAKKRLHIDGKCRIKKDKWQTRE